MPTDSPTPKLAAQRRHALLIALGIALFACKEPQTSRESLPTGSAGKGADSKSSGSGKAGSKADHSAGAGTPTTESCRITGTPKGLPDRLPKRMPSKGGLDTPRWLRRTPGAVDPNLRQRRTSRVVPAIAADDKRGFLEKRIYFATDRKPTGRNTYSGERGTLHYGWCTVSVPKARKTGDIPLPGMFSSPDPKKHMLLIRVVRTGDRVVLRAIRSGVAKTPKKTVLILIHGYNVDFQDAVFRSAQVVVDMKFRGVPLLYTWPSEGDLEDYAADEADAHWTQAHFERVLLDIVAKTGAEQVHVLAHSMGCRVVCGTLRNLALAKRSPQLGEVALAAPDVDAAVFVRDYVPAIRASCRRLTIYASDKDRALSASSALHHYPRAGQGGTELILVPGAQSIDASGIDLGWFDLHHSYYATVRSVLADLGALLEHGRQPEDRQLLRRERAGQTFWLLH